MGWVAVASAVLQGVQAVRGYQADKRAEKETKRANAAMMSAAEEESSLLKQDAAVKAQKEKAEAAKVRSQQIAMYLKSGVTLDGSPLLVGESTTEQGNENARNTISNADSQARSMMLRAQGNQQPIKKADFFGTAATVLGAGNDANTAAKKAGYY